MKIDSGAEDNDDFIDVDDGIQPDVKKYSGPVSSNQQTELSSEVDSHQETELISKLNPHQQSEISVKKGNTQC